MNAPKTPPLRRHLRCFTDAEQKVMSDALLDARRHSNPQQRFVIDSILRDGWMNVDRSLAGAQAVVCDSLDTGYYEEPLDAARRIVQRLAERGLIVPEKGRRR